MNKSIMGWSNKQFYDDRLIAHESVKNHKLEQMYQNVDPSEEIIMMIDTTGCKMGESG
jgi:superfamily I DNA and/or RNA helicase